MTSCRCSTKSLGRRDSPSDALIFCIDINDPRVAAQLEFTVLNFPEVETVEVFVNGVPLDEVLSQM